MFPPKYTPDFTVQGPPNVEMEHHGYLGGVEVPARAPRGVTVTRRSWLTIIALLLLLSLVGCGKKPPIVAPTVVEVIKVQEVQVPVPFKVQPPPELLAALQMPLPIFVAPSDPAASSALTVEGERLLRGLIEELLQRISAWKAWAEAK